MGLAPLVVLATTAHNGVMLAAAVTLLLVPSRVLACLLSAKPVLYACNVGEDDLMEGIENNKYVPLVAARAKEEGARYIPICAKTEEDIADYSPEEKKEFLAEMGIEASGLDNLITALSLIHI